MKKLLFFVFVLCALCAFGSMVSHAELTPPINGEGDDAVIGVATDEDPGDSSVVDLSDSETGAVDSPSFDNETPAGMASGEPILDEE